MSGQERGLLRKIDHIAIAVRSLPEACRIWADLLGLDRWTVEEIPDQRVRVAMLPVGDCRIELLEATAGDSPIAGFLSRKGEGFHHICFEVEDLAGELARLKTAGMRVVDSSPRTGAGGGRIAFLHPSSTAGVMVELSQAPVAVTPHTRSD